MRALIILLLLTPFTSLAQKRVVDVVHFATASAAIDTTAEKKLQSLLSGRDISRVHILLSGHTDSIGSYSYNQQLSKERVESVKSRLANLGVPSSNIHTDHNGEFAPILNRDGMTVNAFNRRVEILISTDGPFVQNGFGGTYDASLIRKPFPNVQLPVERFTVNIDVENKLVTKGGSVIVIPANAFENAYGRVISGNVEVSYREFRTPLDVFASGIPMHVQGGGERQYFETGGMFDITASQRGNPLDLREGQAIQMEFVSTGTPDFNFYTLDSDSGGWVMDNGNMNGIKPIDTVAKGLSPAVIQYLDNLSFFGLRQKEHVSLEETFYTKFPMADLIGSKDKKDRKQVKQWSNMSAYETRIKKRTLPDGRSVNHFSVENRWHGTQNPEWSTFRTLDWEYDGPIASKDLRKLLHRKRHNNLRVRPGRSADGVVLELKGIDTIIAVPLRRHVSPVYSNVDPEKQEAMITKDMARRHRSYARSLAKQEKSLAARTANENARQTREYLKARKRAWSSSKPLMTETEAPMDYATWDAYSLGFTTQYEEFKKQQIVQQPDQPAGRYVVRMLTLDRVGIHNIDIIKQLVRPERVVPEFILANGEVIEWQTTYLFDSNLIGVMASYRTKESTITLDAKALKMIVVESSEGKVYRLETDDVADMNKERKVRSKMRVTPVSKETESLDELRGMLGMSR